MDNERASEWLTYKEAAARLGSTAEAIRYRAIRGRWPRMRANDGRAKVQIPDDPNPVRTPSAPRANGGSDLSLTHALESHINTLRELSQGNPARAVGSGPTQEPTSSWRNVVERAKPGIQVGDSRKRSGGGPTRSKTSTRPVRCCSAAALKVRVVLSVNSCDICALDGLTVKGEFPLSANVLKSRAWSW